jgi:hypothetical protein
LFSRSKLAASRRSVTNDIRFEAARPGNSGSRQNRTAVQFFVTGSFSCCPRWNLVRGSQFTRRLLCQRLRQLARGAVETGSGGAESETKPAAMIRQFEIWKCTPHAVEPHPKTLTTDGTDKHGFLRRKWKTVHSRERTAEVLHSVFIYLSVSTRHARTPRGRSVVKKSLRNAAKLRDNHAFDIRFSARFIKHHILSRIRRYYGKHPR